MTSASSVHVTGMAWCTALGNGLEEVWQHLLHGETGMVRVLSGPGRVRNERAAVIRSVAPDLPASQRLHIIAVETARRALAAAGHDLSDSDLALILGTSLGSYLEDDPPEATAHAWADRAGKALGLSRKPLLVSTACSAGSDAILLGSELIRSGAAQRCLCGGADVLTWAKRLCHSALGSMSPTTLRAFDVCHDGTLFGEGAGFLVLEQPSSGRVPLAVLRGTGSASDAAAMTAPDTSGAAVCLAVERSLQDAGLAAGDIAVVNAHASGTPLNDVTEREAFRRLFSGPRRPVVFGTKGNFGHSLGATGVLEAIATVLALRHGEVPPIVGLEQPDPDFPLPLPLAAAGPVPCPGRCGLSLTLGFGGFNTSLVFECEK